MSKSKNERVKASQAQIDYLMLYMRQNVCLSRPSREKLLSAQEMHEKWEYLALSLNGIEGAKKSMQQWQKTWRDIQNSMRKKGLTTEHNTSTSEHDKFDKHSDVTDMSILNDLRSTETQDMSEKSIDLKSSYRAKLNGRQLDHLLHHMKRNKDMFQPTGQLGRGLQVRAQLEANWAKLTKSLNNLGPPCKQVIRWKQTWRDLRNKLQKNKIKKVKDEGDDESSEDFDLKTWHDLKSRNKLQKKNVKNEEDSESCEATDKQVRNRREGRINQRQLDHIIGHMKRYGGDLLKAVARPGDGAWRQRVRLQEHWSQLATTLNGLGPPRKPLAKWRQTWRDLRRKIEIKGRKLKEISMDELDLNYNGEDTNDSIGEDSKPDLGEEVLFKDATEEDRGDKFEFNPIFVDANPIVIDEANQDSKTESMQCLIDFEKESLELRKRQIALEEKRIELKQQKLITEEAKVQALQRIAAALEQNNINNYNRFNLS